MNFSKIRQKELEGYLLSRRWFRFSRADSGFSVSTDWDGKSQRVRVIFDGANELNRILVDAENTLTRLAEAEGRTASELYSDLVEAIAQ